MILGLTVSALAGVISYIETVTTRGYYFSSFHQVVIPMLNPLIAIAALFAWWWLTRVEAHDESQRKTLQRAYVAFALQYAFTMTLYLLLITPFRNLGSFWLTSVFWFELVGAFISAVGLLLLSRTLSVRETTYDTTAGVGALS